MAIVYNQSPAWPGTAQPVPDCLPVRSAHNLPWRIFQGATNRYEIIWQAGGQLVDLTGCTARLQARRDYADCDDVVLLELSTANGKIIITPLEGKLLLTVAPADTVDARWRRGLWDLEITHPNNDITRLAGGTVELLREVTR